MGNFLSRSATGYNTGLIDRMSLERAVPPFYIDSVNGTNSTTGGRHPDNPLATLAYLITNATALGLTAGDVVVLMPGHNEGIANAQINLATAGITVMGHPAAVGTRVPIFDFDHANAEITISANNIKVKNIKLRPSITSVLIGIEIATGVTGTTLEDIEWMIGEDGAGADEFVKALRLVSGNHDTVMRNLKILAHASAAQATHGIHVDAASDRLVFDNVVIDGPYATNGILEDAAGVNHVVVNCSVEVTGTDDGFHASSTFAKRRNNEFGAASDDSPVETIGTIDATTTDTLHGKLGTDTELADRSIFDLVVSGGPAAAPTPAVAANDVSLYAVASYAQFTQELCLEKTADILTGSDDMFTITGGPIYGMLIGVCTTIIGGASNAKLQITTDTPAATVDLNAGAVAIDNDAAGTSYRNVGATSVFTPVTAGIVIIDPVTVEDCWFLLPTGTIKFNNSAAQTGAIKWYLRYKPLSPNSRVVVAA